MAFVFIAPPIASRTGHHVQAAGLRAEQARYHVIATLRRDAPPLVGRGRHALATVGRDGAVAEPFEAG